MTCNQTVFADKRIMLQNVRLDDDVNPLDLLSSFPSFRSLNRGTCLLLRTRFRADDAYLKALALRGIWDHSDLLGVDESILHSGSITDEGMLDFAFGDYGNDPDDRYLVLNRPSMSPQFLNKLVEVSLDAKSTISGSVFKSTSIRKVNGWFRIVFETRAKERPVHVLSRVRHGRGGVHTDTRYGMGGLRALSEGFQEWLERWFYNGDFPGFRLSGKACKHGEPLFMARI